MNSATLYPPRGSGLLQRFLQSGLLLVLLNAPTARADSWQRLADVPGRRAAHSAVWTGNELIVWGGGVDGQFLNTGARYIPSTDTWQVTSPYGAPSPRWFHAAVWTGSEMIVWGGRPDFFSNGNLNDGARYQPNTDTWTPISNEGAPTGRSQCVAVWSGWEMIIWGGETEDGVPLADGAAYNPVTDKWRPISASSGLAPRMEATAIWTGSEMIIFGGVDTTQPGWLSYGDGARYNPFTDTWTPLPTAGAPSSRTAHTAVWTGERMIVWGGWEAPSRTLLNTGATFDPGANTWTPLPVDAASSGRIYHAAVWSGTEMIVWGGQDLDGVMSNTGARYKPAGRMWTATTQDNAPGKRQFWRPDLGIWTGSGMLICAGSDYPTSLDSTAVYFPVPSVRPPVTTDVLIQFDPPSLPGGSRLIELWNESGFNFVTATGRMAHTDSRVSTNRPGNGTAYLQFGFGQKPLIISNLSGQPFAIKRVDLAEYSTVFPVPKTVTFTGYHADGSSTVQSFTTDGLIDGGGPLADFETFTFSASFSDLVRVEVTPDGYSLDNLLVSVATNAPPPSSPNLVFNGSFELGTVPPGQIDAPNATAITRWTVRTGSIDYYGETWVAGDGSRSLDMNGTSPGSISQDVSGFMVGQKYRLMFLMAGNPYSIPPLPAVKRLRASIGSISQDYSYDATGHTDSNLGWTQELLDFTATSPTMTLTFTSLTDSAGGAALDNVSILLATNAPPPPERSFDLSRDYSLRSNPNGPWSYGYLTELDGTFGLLRASRTFSADNGVPIAAWELETYHLPGVWKVLGPDIAHSDGDHFTADPGTVYFAPGADGAPENFGAIRFTVPAGGQYRIETAVQSLFDHERSRDADFHVLRNGHELFGQFLPPNSATSYSNVVMLAAGDTVDFAIGRGTDGLTADTGLKIQAALTPLNIVTNPPPPPTNCVPAPDGLVAWWRGEGNAQDAAGLHDGAVVGNVTYAPGVVGQGFQFDGLGGYVRIPNDDALDFPRELTIELWYKHEGLPGDAYGFVSARGADVQPVNYAISVIPTGIGPYFNDPTMASGDDAEYGSAYEASRYLPVPSSGVFHHLAVTFRQASATEVELKTFIDGALVRTKRLTAQLANGLNDTAIVIGRSNEDGGEWFQGIIDEVAIYRRALSDAEISAIAAAGAAGKCATNRPPQPPPATSFDLSRDYSLAANPNGPWSYGYLTTLRHGSFGLLRASRTFSADNGVPIAAWELETYHLPGVWKVLGPEVAHSDGDHFTAEPGTVYFAPGADGAPENFGAIRFTVPPGSGGPYRVETSVRSLFDYARSRDADFHVLKNGEELFGQFLAPNSAASYSNVLTLVAGDRIDFAIGRGADGLTADTGLKIQASLTPLTVRTNPPPLRSYDVSRGFSASRNPSGVWTYGYQTTLGGEFALLTFPQTSFADNPVPVDSWSKNGYEPVAVYHNGTTNTSISDDGAGVFPPGTTWFYPGVEGHADNYGVIRFTVPPDGSGIYQLQTEVRAYLDGPRSGDTDFHVLKNGDELFGEFIPGNSGAGYSNRLSLVEGDTIDFAVGRGQDNIAFDSGLKIRASLVLIATPPSPPPLRVYDLSRDYSLAANPNGPWSYGHVTGALNGTFGLVTTARTFGAENGVPIAIWQQIPPGKPWVAKVLGPDTAVSYFFNGPAGTVYFGPDPDAVPEDFGVIRFTTPSDAAGRYRLETAVRTLYDGPRSVDADFHVLKNGQELFGQFLAPNSGTNYSNVLALAAGDTVDFVAGRGVHALANTGLKIQATLTGLVENRMSIDRILSVTDGVCRVIGHAPPGASCHIERSKNLLDWEHAGFAVATNEGVFEFVDLQSPGPACFYRLQEVQP